jgi:hypothetical protein
VVSINTAESLGLDERHVQLGEAHDVRASLRLGSGKLSVAGAAEDLLTARFRYADRAWRPEVDYEIREGTGYLKVHHPDPSLAFLSAPKYRWDLLLSDRVPIHLELRLGSGDASLIMGASQLCTLRGALGSGRLCADLSGGVDTLRLISLKSGSGGSELRLDGGYAALEEITIANASGMNTLLLRGEFPALQHVRLANASGRTELQLEGEMPRLDTIAVNSASGDVTVTLQGAVKHDLPLAVSCVSGVVTVFYVVGTGIIAYHSAVSGRVEAPGFRRAAGAWTNAAYGGAEASVQLSVSTVSGKLLLQPLDSLPRT